MSRRRRHRGRPDRWDPVYLIEVLDRILDKGIVIDAWVRVSVLGIDLLAVDARVVVASLDTYLRYAELAGLGSPGAGPPGGELAGERPDTWALLPSPEAAVRAAEEYLRRLRPGDPSDQPDGPTGGPRGTARTHGKPY